MKKQKILVIICLIGLWAVSCVKENEVINTSKEKSIDKTSTAKRIKRLKTVGFEGTYVLFFKVGHKYSQCGGKCKSGPNGRYHQDCQAWGSECNGNSTVSINKNLPDDPTDIYFTGISLYDYDPSEDSTFSMPARSLYIKGDFENGYIFMNIPEQELIRDSVRNLFIYKNITFTNDALFENL